MFLSIFNLDSNESDDPICQLREGEYAVGRGPLLKCNDQRISRSHALIDVKVEAVTISSTHQNPCFYQAANSKTITILPQNSSKIIEDGDKFGFLPDQYWFKTSISVNKKKEELSDDSSKSSDLLDCKVANDHDVSSVKDEIDLLTQNESNEQQECKEEDSDHLSSDNTQELLENSDRLSKKRSHDDDDDDDESTSCKASKIDNDLTQSESKDDEVKSGDIDAEAHEISSDSLDLLGQVDNENNSNVEREAAANANLGAEETENSNLEVASSDLPTAVSTGGNNQDNADQSQVVSSTIPNANGNNQATSSTKGYRDFCRYGRRCYRKNVAHKKEFSHPGDSDYDTDPEDTRPMCIYGGSCFRKNKLHRVHYRHVKPSSGSEDPFIDSGSDWEDNEPLSDSEESDFLSSQDVEEDTKTLVKEAKKFTRK